MKMHFRKLNILVVASMLLAPWLSGCGKAPLDFSTGSSQQPSSAPPPAQLQTLGNQLRLGGREYISNFLTATYPGADSILTNDVLMQNFQFGESCNIYETVSYQNAAKQVYEDGHVLCSGSNVKLTGANMYTASNANSAGMGHTQMPLVGNSNTLREGWRIQSCEMILDSDTIVQASEQNLIGDKTTPPNAVNLGLLFNQYYPGVTPDPSVIAALQAVAAQGVAVVDQWRWVFLTMCFAPDWQIL